ncbi:hypothetical protein [Planktothrix agardhii]|nr:hypothetical protein [Planktothrix agardhii]
MEPYKAFSIDSPGVEFTIAIKDNYRVGKRSRSHQKFKKNSSKILL